MVSNHRAMDHLVPCHKERIQIFLFCFSFFWLSQSCLLCFVKCVTDCGTDSSPPPCQWQKKVGYRCSRWCFKHKLFWNVYSRMAVSPTLCIDKGWCWSVRLWTPWPFNFWLSGKCHSEFEEEFLHYLYPGWSFKGHSSHMSKVLRSFTDIWDLFSLKLPRLYLTIIHLYEYID